MNVEATPDYRWVFADLVVVAVVELAMEFCYVVYSVVEDHFVFQPFVAVHLAYCNFRVGVDPFLAVAAPCLAEALKIKFKKIGLN